MDESRLETIDARLDILRKLKRKYGGSLQAVLEKLNHIETELSGFENINARIESTKEQLGRLHQRLVDEATQLSMERKQVAEDLSRDVEKEISSLKMAGTRFFVEISPIKAEESTQRFLRTDNALITENGIDQAEFMIAPNVGETLKPLSGIASGGELSRVVLALKAILAYMHSVETVVFDEVDAGIGGGTAEVVGKKLKDLSRHLQIICITHLPQIAKFGDYHYIISKQVKKGRTHTMIKPIRQEERVHEIARMLGGLEITQTTLDHAREMLKNCE
jgi:DNA repair protein RecN (Recombination protein N)